MKKVAHTADWHFNDQNHDEIQRVIEYMIRDIHEQKPDLIVIAGDLTESRNTRLESKSAKSIIGNVLTLSRIAPVVIISGTPSHDGTCPEILRDIDPRVYVSTIPEIFYVDVFGAHPLPPRLVVYPDSIIVSTLPTPTKQYFETSGSINETDRGVADAISGIFMGFGVICSQLDSVNHVHVGHYQVSGSYVSETQTLVGVDIDIHPDQIAIAKADVVCLGHIHKAQKIKDNIFYSGGVTRNTYGELDEKGYYIHTITDGNLESEFRALPTRNLHIIRKDFLESPVNNDAIMTAIQKDLLCDSWVKVEVNVWADEAGEIDKQLIQDFFFDCGCDKVDIDLIRKARETVRSERVVSARTLREKMSEMANIRQEEIGESILDKCTSLETKSQEQLINDIQEVRS